MNKETSIVITSGTIVRAILFIFLFFFLFLIKDLVLVVLVAIVVASAVEPITKWTAAHNVNRVVSVILTYVSIALVFAGVFYFFIPSFLEDASSFLSSAPKYIDSISLWNPLSVSKDEVAQTKNTVSSLSFGISNSQQALSNLTGGEFSLKDTLQSLSKTLSNVSSGFLNIVSFVFGGVLSLILIIVLSFYLAVQEDGIGKFLRIITPIEQENYIIGLWRRAQAKIGLWMQGQMFLALLIGLLVYLGLTVLGIKNALFLAVLAALLETIPLFGPIIASIPAIAIAYNSAGVSSMLLVIGFYVIIHQFENHLIYPLVVKKITGVPPILVILSLIVGYKLAGFLGLILAVPVAMIFMEYLDDLQLRKKMMAGK